MSKKIKILGLVLVAAVLLTAGSATAVMAQDEPYEEETTEEAIIKYIENAVEQGLITPEEATEIITWWQSRPEAVDELLPWLNSGQFSRNCYTRQHMWGNNGDCTPQAFSNAGEVNKFKLQLRNRVNTTNCAGPQFQATNAVCARQQIAIAR
ncbi:hypothetical protein ACFLW0_04590 [Chloroflexota bacterium]